MSSNEISIDPIDEGQRIVQEFLGFVDDREGYRVLACHAALPLVLTNEMLSFLRNTYVSDLPWVAEVELLLSRLFVDTGDDLYVMNHGARAFLLQMMRNDPDLGEERIEEVNRLLVDRLRHLIQNHPALLSTEKDSYRFSAMLSVTNMRDLAAKEIAANIAQQVVGTADNEDNANSNFNRSRLHHLTNIVSQYAELLKDDQYSDLVQLANTTGELLRDFEGSFADSLLKSTQSKIEYRLPGVDQPIVLDKVIRRINPARVGPFNPDGSNPEGPSSANGEGKNPVTNGPDTREGGRVFISYASPDRKHAVRLEAFLNQNQIETFRDESDIRSGTNWDRKIDEELRACSRIVLLLSTHSMPYRKEVHREWFYFDQVGKRIYPLLLDEKCNRHSRLYSYNHIDATRDFQGALDQLLAELRHDEYAAPEPRTLADQVTVLDKGEFVQRSLNETLAAIYQAVTDQTTDAVLSHDEAMMVRDHLVRDEREFRLRTIVEWSLPPYQIFSRFAKMTLLLDDGTEAFERWKRWTPETLWFNDLREVLKKTTEYPAIILLGPPGSGKSTLLRRLQLDHSIDQLRRQGREYSYFVQLNSYTRRGGQTPGDWLAEKWNAECPHRPPLEECLQEGRVLLLLDALNEMPHRDRKDYFELIGLWRDFTWKVARNANRVVYSCRSLDYSAPLSKKDLPIPQVNIQPMTDEQIQEFLRAYLPAAHREVWQQLAGTPHVDLYRTPYLLSLLIGQIANQSTILTGLASLFTAYVRATLSREIVIGGEIFGPGQLFDEDDYERLTNNRWRGPFDLPSSGSPLFEKISALAFGMQHKWVESESAQIRISRDDATRLIDHDRAEEMITAALRMNILDLDVRRDVDLAFFHQLLQEYFAARRLARQPDGALVHVEYEVDRVAEPLEKTVARLAAGDPLPPLPQTGWEETTVTAAPMAIDPVAFIRELIPHNLPLAARCAKSGEISESAELERLREEIREKLLERTQSAKVDLRARIAAGEALGLIGDPRFKRYRGAEGECLLPPLVEIPAGSYPIGDDRSGYDREGPSHKVELAAYRIGVFPVTNAEYRCFIEAGGYEDERWWETKAARYWRREGGAEGSRQSWRAFRHNLQVNWTEQSLQALVENSRATPGQVDDWLETRNWTDEEFQNWLDEQYPSGKVYRQPEFWNNQRFNNPQQPVVGVTWFEARAYCSWLTATSGLEGVVYRLPTEVEFEAAARGLKGRVFPYGEMFDSARCNTFESHIRRAIPAGIFANATPEGAFDLSGNVCTWTSTIFDQEKFPYPWQDDEREYPEDAESRRLVRGGSRGSNQNLARAAYRSGNHPADRNSYVGLRLVSGLRPPSRTFNGMVEDKQQTGNPHRRTSMKVFISYSTKDKETAAKVRARLEAAGITVTIDSESLSAGGDIRAFIDKSIRETDVTLLIVSKSSLKSDWVALESVESFAAEKFLDRKMFLACYLDDEFLRNTFLLEAVEKIDQEIEQLDQQIAKLSTLRIDPVDLQTVKTRKVEMRNNLSKILDRLRSSLTLDIRESEFDNSLRRIVEVVRSLPA